MSENYGERHEYLNFRVGKNLKVYLPSGIKLEGRLVAFDNECLILNNSTYGEQLVILNNITTIQDSERNYNV